MLSAKGVNAWVEIKGPDGTWAKSEEYKTKVEASKVSTYIESIEGRNFRIHIQGRLQSSLFQHRHPDVSGEVLLDGVPVQRRVLYKRKNDPSIIAGQTISSDAEVPFAFAKLRTTDQDEIATRDEQVVKGAGSIVIKVHPIIAKGAKIVNTFTKPKEHILHEKTKKAVLSHSTSFGAPVPTKATFIDVEYLSPSHTPDVVFEFLYRSGDLLEAQGIKQRSEAAQAEQATAVPSVAGPAPVASTSKSANDARPRSISTSESSGNDSCTARKVKQEKLDQQVKIKKEKQQESHGTVRTIEIDESDDDSELNRLKAENARLRKKIKLEGSGGGLVDLTVDSD